MSLDRRLPLFVLLLALGFAYVAGVLCGRGDPLESGNGGREDFAALLLLAPLIFVLGPARSLPDPLARPRPAALRAAGLRYALPFLLGLHYQVLGDVLGVDFSLTAADLGALGPRETAALAGAALVVAGLLAHHVALARREGALLAWAAAPAAAALALAAVTVAVRKTHYLHLHHYAVGAILLPLFRFDTPVSRAAQAFSLALLVEGASRWGFDPMWYPR